MDVGMQWSRFPSRGSLHRKISCRCIEWVFNRRLTPYLGKHVTQHVTPTPIPQTIINVVALWYVIFGSRKPVLDLANCDIWDIWDNIHKATEVSGWQSIIEEAQLWCKTDVKPQTKPIKKDTASLERTDMADKWFPFVAVSRNVSIRWSWRLSEVAQQHCSAVSTPKDGE